MGMAGNQIRPQVATQMAQRAGQQAPQAAQGGMSIPSQVAQAAQGGSQIRPPMMASDPSSQLALSQGTTPYGMPPSPQSMGKAPSIWNQPPGTPDPALAAYQNQANQTQLTGQAANLYNQLGQLAPSMLQGMDKNAIAANPAALQPMIQAAQSYNQMMQTPQGQQLLNNLPAGVDKYAVAANPAAYQQWQQQAKAQEAARPGSTMFAPQQNMPSSPQGMEQALQDQTGMSNLRQMEGPYNPRFQNRQPVAPSLPWLSQFAPQQGMPSLPQGMGGKGGQPPSPQQLGQGLQQQAMMQNQMPLSNQRQPQGGLAGRTAPQVQNSARAAMGSFRGY